MAKHAPSMLFPCNVSYFASSMRRTAVGLVSQLCCCASKVRTLQLIGLAARKHALTTPSALCEARELHSRAMCTRSESPDCSGDALLVACAQERRQS